MKLRILMAVLGLFLALPAFAKEGDEETKRLQNSAKVLREILRVPDNIPQELLDKAECVAVFPSVVKAAFIVGGQFGRGVMVCRSGQTFTGAWGAPSMMALEGGSFGLQIGGQATDFVLLVMNRRGAESLLNSKVKLGADASVAAGPKGREALAATDAYLRAEVLSYSRARGLFAGVALEGSSLRPDENDNADLYGQKLSAKEIVLGGQVRVPPAGQALVNLLQRVSPRNLSDQDEPKKSGSAN